MGVKNFVVYASAGSAPQVFVVDSEDAVMLEIDKAPGKVALYARSLAAWASGCALPQDGLPVEFFLGMNEPCPITITVAVNEAELTQSS